MSAREMPIDRLVDEHLADGLDIFMYGQAVADLTRDQLIATIGYLMKYKDRQMKRHKRDIELFSSTRAP